MGLEESAKYRYNVLREKTGSVGKCMEKELRKRQNLLVEAGSGVILFAIWNVAKVNLYLALSAFPMDEVHRMTMEIGLDEEFFLIFMAVVFAGILIILLSSQLYVGLSATAEGKGKSKSWFYLVLTAVLLVSGIQTSWQAFGVDVILAGEEITLEVITGICMEVASAYVLLQLLISGICVKRLKKKLNV